MNYSVRVSVCLPFGVILQVHDQTNDVFENPDVVMTKFVQTIVDKVIQVR